MQMKFWRVYDKKPHTATKQVRRLSESLSGNVCYRMRRMAGIINYWRYSMRCSSSLRTNCANMRSRSLASSTSLHICSLEMISFLWIRRKETYWNITSSGLFLRRRITISRTYICRTNALFSWLHWARPVSYALERSTARSRGGSFANTFDKVGFSLLIVLS